MKLVPPNFFFLAKVDHYLSAWQVLKKSVCGNILGANILKRGLLGLQLPETWYIKASIYFNTNML